MEQIMFLVWREQWRNVVKSLINMTFKLPCIFVLLVPNSLVIASKQEWRDMEEKEEDQLIGN